MIIVIVALAILVVLITIRYCQKYTNAKYKEFHRIPGPPTLPILGNMLDLGRTSTELLENLLKLTEKYGPIYKLWFGPTFVSLVVSDPKYVENLLITGGIVNKGLFYKILIAWLGQSFVAASGERWQRSRKLLEPIFATRRLENFLPVFNANARKLVAALKSVTPGTNTDVNLHLTFCTLGNMCETIVCPNYSKKFIRTFVTCVRTLMQATFKRAVSPITWFPPFFKLTENYRTQERCVSEIKELIGGVIAERIEETRRDSQMNETVLDVLLSRVNSDDEDKLQCVYDDLVGLTVGGFDSMSQSLGFCVYALSKHPEVQAKLVEEIEAVLGNNDLNADLKLEDVYKMKYLDCVFNEALRMYSPVPFIERTAPDDIILDGILIPKGTPIFIFIMAMHLNKDLFPDPTKFNPDRFLPEHRDNISQYSHIPFSVGLRNCIGKKYATVASKITLCQIIRQFEITAAEPEHTPILTAELTLKSSNGLSVRLKPRKGVNNNHRAMFYI